MTHTILFPKIPFVRSLGVDGKAEESLAGLKEKVRAKSHQNRHVPTGAKVQSVKSRKSRVVDLKALSVISRKSRVVDLKALSVKTRMINVAQKVGEVHIVKRQWDPGSVHPDLSKEGMIPIGNVQMLAPNATNPNAHAVKREDTAPALYEVKLPRIATKKARININKVFLFFWIFPCFNSCAVWMKVQIRKIPNRDKCCDFVVSKVYFW
eukprot:TRINITY_DN5633_c0_g1_i3.p2 TRINITY_DN5633_c0_g1~~TRINITY_DN5633_c0_g1_i3.p2  ORF type:complete len:209 (-),score=24.42 TRINITY_DN5633_c0_g1_i3:106-732(-)